MSDGNWLNSDQRDYINDLAKIPLEKKCWCGWFELSECHCEKKASGLTCADKMKLACPECGDTPMAPGSELTHRVDCSHRVKP